MIVGTAGHIDHGKTALVKALTGVDADRLKEEKARGITIDLGYAYSDLGDGRQLGFVDVPGHERFVHNMLAGATGIDAALLVVSVAEGIKPQTVEHLQIVDLLGIDRGIVALTKADLADDDQILERMAEVETLLASTSLKGAEIVPVSAETGENCERLLALIVAAMPVHPPHFPRESLTDQPETFWVAEAIREKIFRLTHQEVPYACAVRVEELTERHRPECLYIRAIIFVERESQRGIVIGKGATMLKRIGAAARTDLERFFGIKVYLDLTVRVRSDWRKDEKALREFGFLLTS